MFHLIFSYSLVSFFFSVGVIEKKLRINPDDPKINWDLLSGNTNPRAIELLKARLIINPDDPEINWVNLSGNSAPEAIELLKAYESKINMKGLSSNSSEYALKILEVEAELDEDAKKEARFKANSRYKSKINHGDLSGNTNPRAIEILKKIYIQYPGLNSHRILLYLQLIIEPPLYLQLIIEMLLC
jgi:hypothetical protein